MGGTRTLALFITLLSTLSVSLAEISFASYFANSMVLQAEPVKAVVWGYGDDTNAGQTVTVTVAGKQYTATIQTGQIPDRTTWTVTLDATAAGGPYAVEASSQGDVITLSDVMFGDVWICSGQSNMEHVVGNIDDAQTEIDNAVNYPNVRLFRVGHTTSSTPQTDLANILVQWSRPDANNVAGFSGVCWLFGRRLFAQLNKPIGLIHSAWGGTRIEAWSSPQVNQQCPDRRVKRQNQNEESVLWNAMIHPLLPMTIKGAIWYQGESNARNPTKYNCSFPTMINDWRKQFNAQSGQTDINFPFGFVQLAPWRDDPDSTHFCDLRWAQTVSQGYVPNDIMKNVFMSVAMDLPDFDSPHGNIHPRYKQDIGRRLAISGLSVAYGQDMGRWYGPRPSSFARVGNEIEITFENGNAQIDFKNGNGFEVCCSPLGQSTCDEGSGSTWQSASARLEGNSKVRLATDNCDPAITTAQGLRYAWRESPCPLHDCSLYSTQQENAMPTPPFKYEGGFQ